MAANVTMYDAYGRPVRQNDLSREFAAPEFAGIRTIWTDTIASGLTPEGLASVLRAAAEGDHYAYLTLAEEMEERDLHYGSELGKRKLAVSRLPITIESASDAADDVKMADALRALVRKPGFRNLIKDLLDGLGKGYSVAEIMWDRSGSQWRPAKYIWRDPHFFMFDIISRARLLLRDDSDPMGVEMPAYKFIRHLPHIKSGIPIRGGIARVAAWAFMCKGYTVKDWLAFAEVFGMPLRLGKYDAGARTEDKDVLRIAVANLGTDAAAIFPKSMDIELVEASKSGSTDFFERLAQYLDNQVTKGILGQVATTQGTPGKLGNEDAQAEVREDIRDDDALQIEETLNRDLVIPFIDLNFGVQENYPVLCLRAIDREDVAGLSDALAKLVPLGLRVEQSIIRDKLGLPDPPKNAEILSPGKPAAPAVPSALNRLLSALNRSGLDPLDALDAAADEDVSDWRPMMAPVVDPIRQALAQSSDSADFERRLAKVFEKQDVSAIVRSLAAAMFRAHTGGLADEN